MSKFFGRGGCGPGRGERGDEGVKRNVLTVPPLLLEALLSVPCLRGARSLPTTEAFLTTPGAGWALSSVRAVVSALSLPVSGLFLPPTRCFPSLSGRGSEQAWRDLLRPATHSQSIFIESN